MMSAFFWCLESSIMVSNVILFYLFCIYWYVLYLLNICSCANKWETDAVRYIPFKLDYWRIQMVFKASVREHDINVVFFKNVVKSYSKKNESKKKLKKKMKEIDCFWFFTVPVEREKKRLWYHTRILCLLKSRIKKKIKCFTVQYETGKTIWRNQQKCTCKRRS